MGFKDEQEHYRLMLGQTSVVLVSERGSKRLGVPGNEMNAVLMEIDKAEYIYSLIESGKDPLIPENRYAQVSVNPMGKISLRNTQYEPSRLEQLTPEEAKLIGRFKF
jgi:hypothetical protein